MKIAGKRIQKGNILLSASFAAISICILLVLSGARAAQINALNRNSLYSGHQKGFSISHAEDEGQWEEAIPSLASRFRDFAIYVPIQDPEILLRGIYTNGRMDKPPMLWGHYFNAGTSWTERPMAVLGKQYQKDAIERDGTLYYTYHGIKFEVIGIMGTEEESRLNHMVAVDFRSAVKIAGINTGYILDTKDVDGIKNVGMAMQALFRMPTELLIVLENGAGGTMPDILFSSEMIIRTLYVMAMVSFALSAILVIIIWLGFRKQLLLACDICGYGSTHKLIEIAEKFYLPVGSGAAAGLILAKAAALAVPDIRITPSDILTASGMIVGLSTIMLLLCYIFYNRKKAFAGK